MPETKNLISTEIKVGMGDLSKRLREAKNTLGLSNIQLAKELGVSDKTVSNWMEETSEPRMYRIPEINAVLDRLLSPADTSPVELETKPETPPPEPEAVPEVGDSPADRPKVRMLMPDDRRWEVS